MMVRYSCIYLQVIYHDYIQVIHHDYISIAFITIPINNIMCIGKMRPTVVFLSSRSLKYIRHDREFVIGLYINV